jgi:hypothetical protein
MASVLLSAAAATLRPYWSPILNEFGIVRIAQVHSSGHSCRCLVKSSDHVGRDGIGSNNGEVSFLTSEIRGQCKRSRIGPQVGPPHFFGRVEVALFKMRRQGKDLTL